MHEEAWLVELPNSLYIHDGPRTSVTIIIICSEYASGNLFCILFPRYPKRKLEKHEPASFTVVMYSEHLRLLNYVLEKYVRAKKVFIHKYMYIDAKSVMVAS